MPAVERLAELDDLLRRQLSARNLHSRIRDLLTAREIKVGQGWARIGSAIRDHADDIGFLDALEDFVRDAVLASYKRVYLLTRSVADPSNLVPPLPAGLRRDYLAATAPTVPEDQPSFALERRSVGDAVAHTFVTSRPVNKTEEVSPASLTPDGQQQYGGARIVARSEVNLRCYDYIIEIGGLTLLLIDAPEGVDGGDVSRDEANYWTLLRERMHLDDSGGVFQNLFPAVEGLWRDPDEGIVNNLEFVSNNRAQIRGKFSLSSKENYRSHQFQKGGEASGAQVTPYRIAVKWLDRAAHPTMILPGKASMVMGASVLASGGSQPALSYMEIPTYTSWPDFIYMLGRVRKHLELP